jgi:glycosyltransferase involved in cell wall biosynthesis
MEDNIQELMELGERYFKKEDFSLARECFEKIISLNPDHLEAKNNLGVILFQLGQIDEAIDCFQDILKKDGNNEDALANLKMLQNFLQEKVGPIQNVKQRLKVGFVSIWFERGQSYVTKIIRDAVEKEHETFVFARTGGVYGEAKLETSGQWAVPNLTVWPDYAIPGDAIIRWIRENGLDIVIFNEEYDWNLVRTVKMCGVKVLTYLDYYKDEWKGHMNLYDAVLCSTQRAYAQVKDVSRAYHMGWGVDTELFRPSPQEPEYTFFHNAGWLGINFRKMTPAVIAAFDAVSKLMPDVSLFVHSQAKMELLPPVVVDIIHNNLRITYHVETVPAPGLYHKGRILVFPSKLEGLGLPLFEGLSCGLPVIATNAPPMNEFIMDGFNGLLVDVALRTRRNDNIAFPEEIVSMTDLAIKMARLAGDETALSKTRANARRFAEEELPLSALTTRILDILTEVYRQ